MDDVTRRSVSVDDFDIIAVIVLKDDISVAGIDDVQVLKGDATHDATFSEASEADDAVDLMEVTVFGENIRDTAGVTLSRVLGAVDIFIRAVGEVEADIQNVGKGDDEVRHLMFNGIEGCDFLSLSSTGNVTFLKQLEDCEVV